MTDRLAALLEREYGVHVATLTALFDEAERAAYRVDTSEGRTLVARVFDASRPFDRVEGDAAILRYLAHAGVPAEEHVAAADGRLSVHFDTRAVIVTRHIDGERPGGDEDGLRQLGEIAGRLSALRPPPGDKWLNRRAGSLPREDRDYGRSRLDTVPPTLPARQADAVVAIRRALEATSDCETLPTALIHPDCQPGNAIRDRKGRVRLIDWEGAGSGPRIVPLGVLLFQSVIVMGNDEPQTIDLGRVEPVVEGFSRYGCVTEAERDHLGDAIRFRPLVIAAREVSRSIREGQAPATHEWWSRWPDADTIADHARELLRPQRSV